MNEYLHALRSGKTPLSSTKNFAVSTQAVTAKNYDVQGSHARITIGKRAHKS